MKHGSKYYRLGELVLAMASIGLTILPAGKRTAGRGDAPPGTTAGNPRDRGLLAGTLVAATAEAGTLTGRVPAGTFSPVQSAWARFPEAFCWPRLRRLYVASSMVATETLRA